MTKRRILTFGWKEADDEQLRQSIQAKETPGEAAARLYRTISSVKERAQQLGLQFESLRDRRRRLQLRE